MCGFIGSISKNLVNKELLDLSNNMIECRGPDEKKLYFGKLTQFFKSNLDYNFCFIFNRLSIIDLSKRASQPMFSKEFNTMILFNGEIYNHKELRKILEKDGIKFTTKNSDTEVLLMGLSKYGIKFVNKIIGQFAIAFFDMNLNKLFLVRDRLGQKPLFYSLSNDTLYFGSNLLSLKKAVGSDVLNEQKIDEYLSNSVISSPNTIFKNIDKLKPSEIIVIELGSLKIENKLEYWKIESYLDEKIFKKEEFFDIFKNAVFDRLVSDVPVANFLSGGLDSTSIIKSLVDQGIKPNTFSIIYENSKYDERFWINQVVNKYSLNHIYTEITPQIEIDNIFSAIDSFDELYSDPSIYPSFILSREISKFYKVAISGDGGDELLLGYKRLKELFLRRGNLNNFISYFVYFYPSFLGSGTFFNSRSNNLNFAHNSYFQDENFNKLLGLNKCSPIKTNLISNYSESEIKSLLIKEYEFYLSEMMLLKVDRTSMANSLEVRSPFVDNRLVEYLFSHKIEDDFITNQKVLIKNYLAEDFGIKFINRDKMGFVFDLENWIYENILFIQDYILSSNIPITIPKNFFAKLLINKSRINANRIWKLFILSRYFERIK